jgi:tetratricopeptide (TPR) repeat protein
MSVKKKKSNKEPLTPYQNERLYRAVSRLLSMGDFKSDEEAKKFVLNKAKGRSLEEIMDLTEWNLSEKAQALAYKAMESEDPDESLELAVKAQQLDPNCIDALIIITLHKARSNQDIIDGMKRIITLAEQELGREYIEENKGRIWDIVETRPYMRALECLTCFLRETRRFKEAIAQAEEMLELDPKDNQNIRDLLLGMYLEKGDKESARKLINKYPNERMVTFIWGRALESYLSGKPKEAAKLVKKANSKNPFVLDLLAVRKKYTAKYNKYYSPGDKIEAVQCAEEMGSAWKKYPEAMRWLAQVA